MNPFTKITYKYPRSYIEAAGKLDIYTAPYYLEEIKEHMSKKFTSELILEFSKITFIASIGLRTILELHKIMQAKKGVLKLKNVREEVMFSFKVTGFDKFLIVENDPGYVLEDDYTDISGDKSDKHSSNI